MRKFLRAYGHLAAGILIFPLFIATAIGQNPPGEGSRWLNTPLAEGGLKTPRGLPDFSAPVPSLSGARLDAFRNAFYFHFAKPGGGGLDFDVEDSLELAADHVDGANSAQVFQTYQTVFIDRFPAKYDELLKAGKTEDEAFEDAIEYATQQASNVVGSTVWEGRWKAEPATNVEKEVYAWAKRTKASFGGGLTEQQAAALAKNADHWATRGAESYNRLTTHKAVAVRSLFLMANATVPGGGLGYGSERAIALVNEFIPRDHAVTRVEIFRNSFHRHMLDPKTPGQKLSQVERAIQLAKAEAFGAKIEPDVNGGVKVTPGTGAAAK